MRSGSRPVVGKDVDEPAAHGELAALLDALDALVARERQVLDERVDPRLVAAARCGAAPAAASGRRSPRRARPRRRRRARRQRAPRARGAARRRDAAAARGRSRSARRGTGRARPARRRGTSPRPRPRRARRRPRRAARAARDRARRAAPRAPAAAPAPRRARGSAAPRRTRAAVLGAKALDEGVEHGTVHDEGPKRGSGQASWYAGGAASASFDASRRRRLRDSAARAVEPGRYQPLSEPISTRAPVCGAWMNRPPPM